MRKVIGLDLGDKGHVAVVFDEEGREVEVARVTNTAAQVDLGGIKARMQLVRCRTKLVVHVRSMVKGMGTRLPAGSPEAFAQRAREHLPECLRAAQEPVLQMIETLNGQIRELDQKIEHLCTDRYPETQYLDQVKGVGPITSLAYVLTLEDPGRFTQSRSVGPFVGPAPRRDQSGTTDKQLPISKAGNSYLRQLLIGCAHYILGPFGPDSDLRRHGERIAARGGKNAKKRAVVAVARKLAMLLHRLWVSRGVYEPLRNSTPLVTV